MWLCTNEMGGGRGRKTLKRKKGVEEEEQKIFVFKSLETRFFHQSPPSPKKHLSKEQSL
tara:strand:+ start:744 stop:920 length:177 start_codon:yes stop_codon:yes gene_type:complete